MEKYIYSGGQFVNVGNANWQEWQQNQLRFHFKETERDTEWIILYDASRNIWVALPVGDGKSYYKRGDSDWIELYEVRIAKVHDMKSPRFADDPTLQSVFRGECLLQSGDEGSAVQKIQQALIEAGFPLPGYGADSDFGRETEAAVRSYQSAHGLEANGIIGTTTMESLDALFATIQSATIHPKLAFWQDIIIERNRTVRTPAGWTELEDEKKGFRNLADLQTYRMQQRPRFYVPSSPFKSGADIINNINTLFYATLNPIDEVHIFSHSGPTGIHGAKIGERRGLYVPGHSTIPDARDVSQIPHGILANNVIFVLHGCKTASGSQNFAKQLFDSLDSGGLRDAKVWGHTGAPGAGTNVDWKVFYSNKPNGDTSPCPSTTYKLFTTQEVLHLEKLRRNSLLGAP